MFISWGYYWYVGMKSDNRYLSYSFSHLFLYLDNSSVDDNDIKNNFKGNEILLVNDISLYP